MFPKRFLCLMMAIFCAFALAFPAMAAQVDCDATYCFTSQDFSGEQEELAGICITQLPQAHTGTLMLGSRVLRPGDILTAQQVSQMTFLPLRTQQDAEATVTYLPIYDTRVEPQTVMTLSIRGKEDKAPVAEDWAVETYKNLPISGKLKVSDPEGEGLTYTLVRQSKRGTVELKEDGTFTYTPKKNKVGVDSFVFTAADPAGNVSREATVRIQIMKPTDATQYTDTVGEDFRFQAEWLRNTGIFAGEEIGGQSCFYPEKTVSRGEFMTMLVKALDIPTQQESLDAVPADTPQWLKPYLAAALRAGLQEGLPQSETGSFDAHTPISGAEVAVMLQNALDLTASQQALEAEQTVAEGEDIPAWANSSLTILSSNGLALEASAPLTRAQAAQVLYQACRLAVTAPGTAIFSAVEP